MENIEMTNEVLENTQDTEIAYSDPTNTEENDILETSGGGNVLAIVVGVAIVGVVSGICWLGSKLVQKVKDQTPEEDEDTAPKGIKKLFGKFKKNKTEETPEEEEVEEK